MSAVICTALLGIHKGSPAIYDPTTGDCVVVFKRSASGWSKAVKLAVELAREIATMESKAAA